MVFEVLGWMWSPREETQRNSPHDPLRSGLQTEEKERGLGSLPGALGQHSVRGDGSMEPPNAGLERMIVDLVSLRSLKALTRVEGQGAEGGSTTFGEVLPWKEAENCQSTWRAFWRGGKFGLVWSPGCMKEDKCVYVDGWELRAEELSEGTHARVYPCSGLGLG